MRIALDAMGGDFAPQNNLEGLLLALNELPQITEVHLVGPPDELEARLQECGLDQHPKVKLAPATQVVTMDDPPIAPLRQKKDSTISVAAKLMKAGTVDAVVSGGHTGATTASTVVHNRTLKGIERPGIAAPFPSLKGSYILIDVGAHVDCKPVHLAQYAMMGESYAKLIMGIENPSVGILSVGEEAGKGNEVTRHTIEICSRLPLVNFLGNVEGRDLFSGNVDVVVADGFVGNIVLKTCEDLAKVMTKLLKERLMKTPVRKAGALLSRNAFRELRQITDHDEYGGAPLLGINGTCIIAHGSSSPKAYKNALRVATEVIERRVNGHIEEQIANIDWQAVTKVSE